MKTPTFLCHLCFSILLIFSCAPNSAGVEKSQIDALVESKITRAEAIVDSTNNYSDARKVLISVLDIEQFHFSSDSIRSMSFHKLGSYSYQLDQIENAITFLDSAISIRTSNSNTPPSETAQSYYVRSLSFEKSLNYVEAISNINQAISLIKSSNYNLETLNTYYLSAAKYYALTNEFSKAEQYYDFISKNINESSEEYIHFTTNKAMLYGSLGHIDKAKGLYEEAINLLINKPALGDNLLTARFNLLNLSILEMEFNEMLQAYEGFEKSFEAKNNHQKNAKLYIFHNLAYYYLDHGNTKKSRENYLNALDIAKQLSTSKNSVDIAEVFEGLGDVDAAEGNFEKSILNYHKAIMALCIGFESSDPYALPNINEHIIINLESLQRIMGFKAVALYNKYMSTGDINDLESTFELYKTLDIILVRIRQGFQSSPSTYNFLEKVLSYYEKAVQVSLELYRKKNDKNYLKHAYSFATKNKAIVLLDGIQNDQAMVAGIPLKILKKEESLQKEIYELDSNINGLINNNQDEIKDVDKQINLRFNKIMEYEELIRNMEKDFPKYYNLKYANLEIVNTEKIRNRLTDSTAVIEYFIGNDNIYSFIYAKDRKLEYIVKEKPANFVQLCDDFREMIQEDSLIQIKSFEAVSEKLYTLLLDNELQIINANGNIKELIIIPDDHLFRISFDPLLTSALPPDKKLEWINELPFLIRKYAISYAYSNRILFEPENQNSKRNKYLGFGLEYDDYTLDAFDEVSTNSLQERLTRRIGKLVYSDDEVIESAKILGGKYFINEKATKPKFLKEASKANILHLVTHGFIHNANPLNSGLVFSKEKDDNDFILRAGQLYTMKLNADLAVLSACHSGYGNLQKGEGIRSLARAFNYAGCPNVTASLWAAPDLSTKQIIVPFYKYIKQGKSKDEALRMSKLDYLDNCAFDKEAWPCNWAHLICIGDTRPLY